MAVANPEVSGVRAPATNGVGKALVKVWRNYALRRVLRAIFVIWVVATAVFFLVRLLPGNPVQVYINSQIAQYGVSYEDAAASARSYFSFDPTTPLIVQYLQYLLGLLHGDLGISIATRGVPVIDVIGRYLPWTLFSVGIGMIISIVVGLLLGMVMAYRRGGVIDHGVTAVGSILHAIPNYIMAIMIVVILGAELGIYDVGAARGTITSGVEPSFSLSFFSDVMYHAQMPILTYVLTTAGTWALVMKSSTTQVLEEDYVMVARARGLGDNRIRGAYVGRNAVLPLVAQIATQAGFVVGGAIFVEQTFQYTGIGASLYAALQTRDYTVLQGILLILTASVVFANLIADLIYSVLDPRIRVGEGEA
ncbi:peptide/nickel transport system permease protein [Friedmanniella endophytica]|uniref:Peptide/nickel transport system permease protein n=1 Tax=Microlunatus kandeliicorticis TaxID=1759536 RepID=A0A7W3IU84_9ACTN|nr:ABC transporter permease [Microlunatus kandeliicorticis]MBA8795366.1 peptide/nickel transport system permease protein [Microlunatus kandeliicorticis]